MSQNANEDLVRAFYDRVLAGDVKEAVAEYLTPDVVWENPLPEPIPFGGIFEGAQGAGRYLRLLFEQVQIEDFQIDRIVVDGDCVVVLGSETSRVSATGRVYRMEWVHVLGLRGKKIETLREYNDTAAMLAAFR